MLTLNVRLTRRPIGSDVNIRSDNNGHGLVANGSRMPMSAPPATSIRSIHAAGNLRGEGTPNLVGDSPAAQNTGGEITTAGDIPHPDGTHMPIGRDLPATHSDASGTAPLTLKCNRKCKGAEKPIAEFSRSRTGVACNDCLELDRVYYRNSVRNKAQKAAASGQPPPPRAALIATQATGTPAQEPQVPTLRVQHTVHHESPAQSTMSSQPAAPSGPSTAIVAEFRRVLSSTGIGRLRPQEVVILDMESFMVSQHHRTLHQVYPSINEALLHMLYSRALQYYIDNGGNVPEA
jgi:hypothetical protein